MGLDGMSGGVHDDVLLVSGGTLLRSDADGGIRVGSSAAGRLQGLFHDDVRLLSTWVLSVDRRLLDVASSQIEGGRRVVALLPPTARNETGDLLVVVTQEVSAAGLDQTIELRNTAAHELRLSVELAVGTDFADPFTLRSDRRSFDRNGSERRVEIEGSSLVLGYRRSRGELAFETGVRVSAEEDGGDDGPVVTVEPAAAYCGTDAGAATATLAWAFSLAVGGSRVLRVRAEPLIAAAPLEAIEEAAAPPLPEGPRGPAASVRRQGLADLRSLRMTAPGLGAIPIVAAGVPWFLTLFGRDSLVTSMLAETDLPGLSTGVLRALAATQATTVDEASIAEPGKIVHELRVSELATLGEVPYGRYYGSVDSTPLFVTGLARLARAGGPGSPGGLLADDLRGAVRAAVDWMRGPGGLDRRGFLSYVPDPSGLIHQGWKDSFDAIAHADGTLVDGGAIALCEVQGYAWRALTDAAGLARDRWHDDEWAHELQTAADALRLRFRESFWMADEDFPALALDGDGRRMEVVASNAGHLLFSGILDRTDAERVTRRLLEPDMFSGWGIRTLSTTAALYHPMSYHNGSVWPHDTVIAALGMAGYGFIAESQQIAGALVQAAEHFDHRLPELFGGFARDETALPIGYAHAARPQAWAAAAGVAAARLLA
jgi:glycogen debranching enzyme